MCIRPNVREKSGPPDTRRRTSRTMRHWLACLLVLAVLVLMSLTAFAVADIEVLSWTWYRNDWGYYQVVGEVENVGTSNAQFVMLTATWYSDAGSVVGTDFSFSLLDVIQPTERSPFQITLFDDDVQADRVRLQWSWDETGKLPGRSVQVRDISASYDSDMECLSVIGEVENLGPRAADYVMILITCYNEEDEVIAVDFTFSTLDEVASGNTSPFKTYICDRARQIVRYRYIVQHGL